MKRVSVIPTYKPDDRLLCTVDELVRYGMEVVVVDDGSGEPYDELFAQVRDRGASVIRLPHSQGKGEALKEGMRRVLRNENGDCTLVTIDGNDRYATRDIFRVCIEAEQHPEAIALGCRTLEKGAGFTSRIGNALTKLAYRICSGIAVLDIQPTLCAFSGQTIAWIASIPGSQAEYERNLLMTAAKFKIPLHQLTIESGGAPDKAPARKDSLAVYWRIIKQIVVQRTHLRPGKMMT